MMPWHANESPGILSKSETDIHSLSAAGTYTEYCLSENGLEPVVHVTASVCVCVLVYGYE